MAVAPFAVIAMLALAGPAIAAVILAIQLHRRSQV
jgi:hypothetical protein